MWQKRNNLPTYMSLVAIGATVSLDTRDTFYIIEGDTSDEINLWHRDLVNGRQEYWRDDVLEHQEHIRQENWQAIAQDWYDKIIKEETNA